MPAVQPVGATLYLLPVRTRVPWEFGGVTLHAVTCARVCLEVAGAGGRRACGWGETPLSALWAWPSALPAADRERAMCVFCAQLAALWAGCGLTGHPLAVGHAFLEEVLPVALRRFNAERAGQEPMPRLAALVCCAAFDLALHDAWGMLLGLPTYDTYSAEHGAPDLGDLLQPAVGADVSFTARHPADYLLRSRVQRLPVWHAVGGRDPLEQQDLEGGEPSDGYPVLLRDWIRRDGLRCLKVKLRGTDAAWDLQRLRRVGRIAQEEGCTHLSADFNCTVREPAYVAEVLDHLAATEPETYHRLLYVEQPFPYDLEAYPYDVRALAARRPLFLDESAHDWRLIRLGRSLGWTGVALKTCKTQTGAILGLCWARAHGMSLMVQDLTNPMLAQIAHVLLAAHAGTLLGVESNAVQFYPDASLPEAQVHPGLYRRREGQLDLRSVHGPGFGYRLQEIRRTLPAPTAHCQD